MAAEPSVEPLSTTIGWKRRENDLSTMGSASASSSTGRTTSASIDPDIIQSYVPDA